jgi:hypothetical protein
MYCPQPAFPMLALGQKHEVSYLPRLHMQWGTIWQQTGVDTRHTIGAKSTFEIFCVVGSQPKFALVDMFSHAFCKNRRNVGKQSTFPTT